MATVEERLTALEAAVSTIEESVYNLRFSGEEVDKACENALKIHCGTETITTSGGSVVTAKLSGITGFVPSQIIVSLRTNDAPTPYFNTVCTVYKNGGAYFVMLVNGANQGNHTYSVTSGTYYVDWIAIE